ncbi:MAG: hypothetical protein ABI474_09760 [Actinomycetota bacterium]
MPYHHATPEAGSGSGQFAPATALACVSGISVPTVGVVLMLVGIAGLIISIVLASTARRTDVIHHETRREYVEQPLDDPRI